MKKVALILMLGLLVTSLTGCSTKTNREVTNDYTEEIVEKTVSDFGFKSKVICEKGIINIDNYSTLKGTAQQIEEKLIANNIIVKNVEIGTSGDKIKVNYNFSDESFLLIWFNESETINSITYTNEKEDTIRKISRILTSMSELNLPEEDRNRISDLDEDDGKVQFGNWNAILTKDSAKYVFQITEI